MKLKTFIKWSGNKSKHLRHILPYIPEEYNTYYEPFVGSGALFLHLQPKKWVINDLNKDLINCWKAVRDEPETIIDIFKEFDKNIKAMSKEKKLEYCRNITNYIEKIPYNIIRASLYLLMKSSVYMGNLLINNKLYFKGFDLNITTNNRYFFLKKKKFNNFKNISKFLNTFGKIYNETYEKILKYTVKNDFVFLDPPYIEEHDYDFNYNRKENLNKHFIYELYKQVKKLDQKGVKWLMTQADTKEIKKIFKKYNIKKFKVYRIYNKTFKNELIIMNY